MSPLLRAFSGPATVIAVALAAAIAILLWWRKDAMLPPDAVPSQDPLLAAQPAADEPQEGATDLEAGPVRILVKSLQADAGGDAGSVLAEIEHQGPLLGRDRELLLAGLEQRLLDRESRIQRSDADASDSAAVRQEAEWI